MSSLVHSTLLRAHKYAKNGDFDAAEVCYKSILSKFPKNKRAIQAYRDFKLGANFKTPSGQSLFIKGRTDENISFLTIFKHRGEEKP